MTPFFRGLSLFLLAFVVFIAGCDSASSPAPDLSETSEEVAATSKAGARLVWKDSFDGNSLDLSKWHYRKLGPRKGAENVKEAVDVSNGTLKIRMFSDPNDKIRDAQNSNVMTPHKGGMIATNKEFLYGRFEADVVRSDLKSGCYDAFWLQSRKDHMADKPGEERKYGNEITAFEHRADKLWNIYHGLHWIGYSKPGPGVDPGDEHYHVWTEAQGTMNVKGPGKTGRMLWTVEWTPSEIRMYVDGELTWRVKDKTLRSINHPNDAPYHISAHPEEIILSMETHYGKARGHAGWTPDSYGKKGASTNCVLEIDEVRVYDLGQGTTDSGTTTEPKPQEPTVEPTPEEPAVEPTPEEPTVEPVDDNSGDAAGQAPYNNTIVTLPGRIEAERYDVGGEGVAYHDKDARNRASSSFRTREGVDASGKVIGWMHTGEWMEYTVNVKESGTYDLIPRVASIYGYSKIRVEAKSRRLGSKLVPKTGAWNRYVDMRLSNVQLSAGKQVLRVFVARGGFNLDRIDVVKTGSAITRISDPVPSDPVHVPTSGNLLKNASFENGTNYWGAWGTDLRITSTPVYTGSKAAVVKNRRQSHHGPVQNITAALKASGKGRYAVKAAVKASRGESNANVIIKIIDDAGTHYHLGAPRKAGSSWVVVDNQVDVKWTGTLKKANLYISLMDARADLHADSASLTKVN